MRKLELMFTSDNIPQFLVEFREFLLEAEYLEYFQLIFNEAYPELTSVLPEECEEMSDSRGSYPTTKHAKTTTTGTINATIPPDIIIQDEKGENIWNPKYQE